MSDAIFKSADLIDWSNPVNRGHALNRGLVLWLLAQPNRLGWKSNRWRCALGYNYATLTNMDPATDWLVDNNRIGGAGRLDFDGSNDTASLLSAKLSGRSNLATSVSFWERSTYKQFSGSLVFDNAGIVHTKNNHWGVILHGNVRRHFSVGPSSSQWYHLTATWSAAIASSTLENTSVKVYVNGIESAGTFQGDAGYGRSGVYQIATGYLGSVTNGTWDDMRVWNRELTASEVYQAYRESVAGNWNLLNRIPLPLAFMEQAGGGTILPMFNHYQCSQEAD